MVFLFSIFLHLKGKFTRTVADFRNLQDRTEREKRAAKDFAIQGFAKDLVDSVDNFDRALSAVPEEVRANADKNKELVDLYNGLKMTEEILLGTLKKHGLEKIDPAGEPFDPNRHEAVYQLAVPDKEPNTVFHVQQTGFSLNGRTIRVSDHPIPFQPRRGAFVDIILTGFLCSRLLKLAWFRLRDDNYDRTIIDANSEFDTNDAIFLDVCVNNPFPKTGGCPVSCIHIPCSVHIISSPFSISDEKNNNHQSLARWIKKALECIFSNRARNRVDISHRFGIGPFFVLFLTATLRRASRQQQISHLPGDY